MNEKRSSLERLLSDLDRDQLQSLLLKLTGHDPSLITVIEGQVALFRPATSPQHPPIDPKAIRRQVRSAIRSLDRMSSSEAYWQISTVVESIQHIVDQAWTLIKADNGRDALIVLEAVTEEYLSEWENLDDSDGEASGFFTDLGPTWAEALLSADLTSQERKLWAKRLTNWQEGLDDYGVDEAFAGAAAAARDGWDSPPLKRVLAGTITEQGAWKGEPPLYADELTEARLHILEQRERFQEYLYLAEAEGHTEEYITMLVRLGRVQEAFDYGLQYLGTTQEALALADALAEHGERERSLTIAEHGLSLEGQKASLAKWLREQAEAMGKTDLALRAAEIAYQEEISLENYLRVAAIAGEQWTERRTALLEYTRSKKSFSQQGQVDVFLHENLLDDAIAALEPYASHTLIEQVVNAALQSQSQFEWIIQACRKQAEPIIEGGKAEYYYAAAKWLAKARTAYQALGRDEEWQTYLNDLLNRHGRKYKLVPMLKALL
jgi:uncharacterized Zn finger protein